MWNVANPGASPSVTAKRCVRVNAKYKGKLVKEGSSDSPPTDIDIAYDTITVGAGWILYNAGDTNGLSSTASSVYTSIKYFKPDSEYTFSFPSQTIDFGAFVEAEPETAIAGISISIYAILATAFVT